MCTQNTEYKWKIVGKFEIISSLTPRKAFVDFCVYLRPENTMLEGSGTGGERSARTLTRLIAHNNKSSLKWGNQKKRKNKNREQMKMDNSKLKGSPLRARGDRAPLGAHV